MNWLPDMDLNHDKQIQSLLCYRYTIGQRRAFKVEWPPTESRLVKELNRWTVKSSELSSPCRTPFPTLHRLNGSTA